MRLSRCLLIAALCIHCCAMTGCIESSFQLAPESRLPKWIVIPPGRTRADVSVEMTYYTPPLGVKFRLRDKNGRTLATAKGKCRDSNPKQPGFVYPAYEEVTVNGTTEIIEHKKMEPIFYVWDDPALTK